MRQAGPGARRRSRAFGEPRRQSQRRNQACRVGGAGAGDVECGAVIRRGAHEGQAERDIDGVIEGERLDRDQRLIVIHAQCRVVARARLGMKHGIRRQRPPGVDALGDQPRHRRRNDAAVLFAQRAVFAGMRIKSGDREARALSLNRVIRSCATMRAVSTISSLESCGKISRSGRWIVTGTTASSGDHSIITGRNDLPVASLHQSGQKFGVAGLGKAPIVENIFGDRIGHDSRRLARHDIGDGATDRSHGRGRARIVGLPWLRGDGHVERQHRERLVKLRCCRRRRYGGDRNVELERLGAPAQESRIGDNIKRRQCRVRRASSKPRV